jgi:hypothetical protein
MAIDPAPGVCSFLVPRPSTVTHTWIGRGTRSRPFIRSHEADTSYEVCPNCGFEFGNDDNPGTTHGVSFEEYRAEWIAEGHSGFDPDSGVISMGQRNTS